MSVLGLLKSKHVKCFYIALFLLSYQSNFNSGHLSKHTF